MKRSCSNFSLFVKIYTHMHRVGVYKENESLFCTKIDGDVDAPTRIQEGCVFLVSLFPLFLIFCLSSACLFLFASASVCVCAQYVNNYLMASLLSFQEFLNPYFQRCGKTGMEMLRRGKC